MVTCPGPHYSRSMLTSTHSVPTQLRIKTATLILTLESASARMWLTEAGSSATAIGLIEK
jgi:hypothetical protein